LTSAGISNYDFQLNIPVGLTEEPRMQIEERSEGSVKILDVTGKITQGDALFRDKIHSMINQGHKKILVNMSGVTYVDSAGLGELVGAYTTVKRSGGSLKLHSVTSKINELLTITKLLTVFETFDQETEAVQSFN
jgi:anti-sigma B factor antagonist